jgi:hypothetical protein
MDPSKPPTHVRLVGHDDASKPVLRIGPIRTRIPSIAVVAGAVEIGAADTQRKIAAFKRDEPSPILRDDEFDRERLRGKAASKVLGEPVPE